MRVLFIILVVFIGIESSYAQFLSTYHEQHLIYSQSTGLNSNFYNPRSKRPKRLTYVLPSFGVTLVSPQLTYGDMYDADTKTLSLVAASESGKDYSLQLNARVSYGGLSYKYQNFNFSFFHELLADGHLNVPNQMFELVTKGNAKFRDASVDINPYAFLQSTHKWSVGIDYQWEKLMAGVQFNVYTGNAYLNTNSSKLSIDFEQNFFEFGFDKDINVESSGVINYHAVDSIDVLLADNVFTGFGSFSNLGLGISAQFKYEPFESLKIYGRVDDLGYIRWNHEAEVLTDKSRSKFGGVDIRQSYVTGEPYSVEDTLYSKLNIDRQMTAFTSPLLYSLFLGIDYGLNDYVSIGGLVRARNNGAQYLFFIEPQVTLKPLDNLRLSISNIMTASNAFNPKFVLHTELGQTFGFNLAVVNPWKFGKYYDVQLLHASLGMYLKFMRGD